MAREVQNGRARIFGIRNNGTPITITGYASFTIDTMKASSKWDKEKLKDENGYTQTVIWADGSIEIDVAFEPSAASIDDAHGLAVFIQPGAKCTISGVKVAIFNGDTYCDGDQSIDLSQKTGKMTLKVIKHFDAAQNASLVETVSP